MAKEDAPIVGEGFLRLVSGDGFSFVVDEEYAMVSNVIRRMMKSTFKESRTRVIHLPGFSGCVIEKICQYFYYMARFQSRQQQSLSLAKSGTEASSVSALDSFADSFHVPQDMGREMLECAFYLEL